MTQAHPSSRTLNFDDIKTKVVATIVSRLGKSGMLNCMVWGKESRSSTQKGWPQQKQRNSRIGFKVVIICELTRLENQRAQEGLMLLTYKSSGGVKGQLAHNRKRARDWILREDMCFPTLLTESLMMTCTVDAHKGGNVMIFDISNSYIQACVSK